MAKKKLITLITHGAYVIMDNGLVRLTISKPQGYVTGINYAGVDNLLDLKSNESSRGYWDVNWSLPGGRDRYQQIKGSEYNVITMSKDQVELSFRTTYDPSVPEVRLPISIDLRYILKSGVSGFHCYAIYEVPPGCRAFDLAQTRMVFKLRREMFHYMAISDEKQRIMPMEEDLEKGRGRELIVPESVLLVNPINRDLKGEVDDKYQYSLDNKDGGVHGWISGSSAAYPASFFVGFWLIFPSHEFRNGGPTKQNLTVHTGPFCLAMLHGTHYIGPEMVAHFQQGETWTKVFGPFFVYLNNSSSSTKHHVSTADTLWADAKHQRLQEESAWPYDFVSSPYYLTAKERASVSGQLFVQDRFVSGSLIAAKHAFVGLSTATTQGSWQIESKGYQFWVQTDASGRFKINNVIPGVGIVYWLHAWVPGFVGDYLSQQPVTLSSGSDTKLGNLVYVPPRDGPTLWEIGYPDRTAIGFYIPDVNPLYVNKLFLHTPEEKYRQYGLWDRYTDLNPDSDQVFTIGISDPKKNWFFAHVDRRSEDNNKYVRTTWTIKFKLGSINRGMYKLRIAIASATRSNMHVQVNNSSICCMEDLQEQEDASAVIIEGGADNTVCRHGIHGLYRLFSVAISSSSLFAHEDNSILLIQARGGDALCGVLYDYLRLEAPPFNY